MVDDFREIVAAIRELQACLSELGPQDKKFAESLIQAFEMRGDLSDKQFDWVHKLTKQAIEKDAPAEPLIIEASRLYDMFNLAAAKMQRPVIRYKLGEINLKFKLAGDQGQFPGTINIFGKGGWMGRIMEDGELRTNSVATDEIIEGLTAFALDPAAAAVECARVTSICCFCGLALVTKESVFAGYGPICAEHWGLPWGETGEPEVESDDDLLDFDTGYYGEGHDENYYGE